MVRGGEKNTKKNQDTWEDVFFFPKPGGLGLTSRGGFGFAGPLAWFLLVAECWEREGGAVWNLLGNQ